MNHFDQLKHIFYQNIEKECFGTSKEKAYFHSLSVCHLCQKIALERHLNIQLWDSFMITVNLSITLLFITQKSAVK